MALPIRPAEIVAAVTAAARRPASCPAQLVSQPSSPLPTAPPEQLRDAGNSGIGVPRCSRLSSGAGGGGGTPPTPGDAVTTTAARGSADGALGGDQQQLQQPGATAVFAKLRVMVVDDVALNLKVAVSLLRKIGVTVAKQAVNGEEAAQAAAEKPFDVIFMARLSCPPVRPGPCAARLLPSHHACYLQRERASAVLLPHLPRLASIFVFQFLLLCRRIWRCQSATARRCGVFFAFLHHVYYWRLRSFFAEGGTSKLCSAPSPPIRLSSVCSVRCSDDARAPGWSRRDSPSSSPPRHCSPRAAFAPTSARGGSRHATSSPLLRTPRPTIATSVSPRECQTSCAHKKATPFLTRSV